MPVVVSVPDAPRPIPASCRPVVDDLPPLTADEVVEGPSGLLAVTVPAYTTIRMIALEERASRGACYADLQAAEAAPAVTP